MSATNRGSKRIESDFYATPLPSIDLILDEIEMKGNILEPSCGNGNIIHAIRERERNVNITGLELREKEREGLEGMCDTVYIGNFLEWEKDKEYDIIIGNPPYSLALEFMEKCFEVANENTKIIMLLRTAFLESKKRVEFWRKHPLNELYVLSKRPSFTGKGTDATSYSWFVWDMNSDNQKIKVLDPK